MGNAQQRGRLRNRCLPHTAMATYAVNGKVRIVIIICTCVTTIIRQNILTRQAPGIHCSIVCVYTRRLLTLINGVREQGLRQI